MDVLRSNTMTNTVGNSVIRNKHIATAYCDGDFKIVVSNDAFNSFFGFQIDLQHLSLAALPVAKSPYFNHVLEGLKDRLFDFRELEIDFKSILEESKTVSLSIGRVFGEENNIHFFIQLRDITSIVSKQQVLEKKIKQLEAEIVQLRSTSGASDDLKNFAYAASHDLREPVRMINNFSHLLERRYSTQLEGEGMEFLRYIKQSVTNMDSLILGLLEFSRLNTVSTDYTNINIEEIVQLAVYKVKRDFPSLADFELQVQHLPRSIYGSRTNLQTLFFHLIQNAALYKHKDQKVMINVNCNLVGDMYEFRIIDNGIGIASQHHEHIFGLFKRLHPRDHFAGNGMGLAVCKKIAQLHFGDCYIESSTPNEGSTIVVKIKKASKEL